MTYPDDPHVEELIQEAQKIIAFEDDPHNAALQDNPESVKVSWGTWAAVFFLAISFGPPIGLGVVTYASVIFPITSALGDASAITWATGSWGLASAVSFGLTGPLSDVFGRRWPILIGQALAIVGCSVCAAAQNTNMLIAGQATNGFASGLIFIAYAGVPEMLPNKHRALGLGLLEAGIGIPWGIVAIILGNALYAHASWRWIFYISVIVEVIALVGTASTYFPLPRPRGDYDKSRWEEFKEIDFIGVSLFAAGLTTLLIGLTWGGSEDHSWKSASTIAPINIGAAVIAATMFYEAYLAPNPIYSTSLFKNVRGYSSLWVIVFVASMQGFPMASLIPRGYMDMFTTDPNKIGVYSLPLTVTQSLTSVLGGVFAKKVGHIKWQLIFWLFLQAAFLSATAATVYPNNRDAFIWVPAFSASLFPVIVLLAYAMASLHIPHSMLGLALGLLATARGAGSSVGSAIFYTVFNNRFEHYVGLEVAPVALRNGLNPADLPQIISGAITYNLDVPHSLDGINGITPAIKDLLREAVRSAYGHAFKMVFYVTIPFTVVALLCGFLAKDVTVYMTNHTQFRMSKSITTHHKEDDNGERGKMDSSAASARQVEQTEVEDIFTVAPKALQ
ncbi:major facilitator superfamily transporter [Pyrenochaeta sp. MPI-SDFR-AT-0127]|nr:major facilitator superfamily transporter [Pyrenochaeta sp. MPI-SDFR-AT-0127]